MTLKTTLGTIVATICTVVGSAHVQFQTPEQFYTNGQKIDGWTRNPGKQLNYPLFRA